MKFYKYHALGNDYIVLKSEDGADKLSKKEVVRICHRNFGVGSDGILLHLPQNNNGQFVLRILNPDGSEAEKSGNGLRIYSRFLYDRGFVQDGQFAVKTKGGDVRCEVWQQGQMVSVEMGRVSFLSSVIPVAGAEREVLREQIEILGEKFEFSAATVGNPHCVLIRNKALEAEAKKFGPHLEVEPRFPNRTNVQFMEIIDRNNIRIEIWERGAGYTLASGSSASASAAVAYKLGLCDEKITVHMVGGKLSITLSANFEVFMSGEVTRVAEGEFFDEMLRW